MKKSLFALAALTAFAGAAQAQSTVTMYGIFDVGVANITGASTTGASTNATNGTVLGMQNGGLATPRLGFKGTEDLGGGLKANFLLESELLDSNGSNLTVLFKRGAWVGLENTIGEIRLGRQNTATYDFNAKYDAMNGGNVGAVNTIVEKTAITSGSGNLLSSYGSDRNDNTVQLRTKDFNGLTARVGYTFGGVAGNTDASKVWEGGLEYVHGGLSLAASYIELYDANGNKATTNTSVYAMYDAGFARFNASHNETKGQLTGGTKFTADTVGVRVPVTTATTLIGQYIMVQNDQQINGSTTKPTTVSGGVQYDLSKRTAVYGLFSVTNQDGNSALQSVSTSKFNTSAAAGVAPSAGVNQTVTMIGVRHSF